MRFIVGLLCSAFAVQAAEHATAQSGFQIVEDRATLLKEKQDATAEKISAVKELEAAQSRLRDLGEKMQRGAAEDPIDQGQARLRGALEMKRLDAEIQKHVDAVSHFSFRSL
eukprot:TRINITY_DN91470_c0_g1_i1.p2 TRINITY_DN91470_c0_g1~~TRINITY_DN91470_c0_g1_i1.p2  ORF type:complete len:112 (+),score=27.95 TRINITY_DN91470_c0_g1_i1:63-398(+)